MNIDVDSHYTPPGTYDNTPSQYSDAPRLVSGKLVLNNGLELGYSNSNYDIKRFINAMKEAGFDKQCLNVSLPNGWMARWLRPETELYLAKARNDQLAKVVAEHDCFIGVAQVPQRDPVQAAAEAERAVKDLGLLAINIEGQWAGKNIASTEWWDFFATVEKLGVPLFNHPDAVSTKNMYSPFLAGHDQLEKMPKPAGGLLSLLVQNQIAMMSLIFLGVLDKFPKLKFAWLETEVGWIPSFIDFMEEAYHIHKIARHSEGFIPLKESQIETISLKKKPSQYFKDNFYYSIGLATDVQLNHLVPLLIDKVGLGNNLMTQSDFDHVEGDLDIVRHIVQAKGISDEAKERIRGRNAAELLKIKWAPSAYEKLYA